MDAEQWAQAIEESFGGMLWKGIWTQAMFEETLCERLSYPYTLDMTHVYNGWTEVQAVQNKVQVWSLPRSRSYGLRWRG